MLERRVEALEPPATGAVVWLLRGMIQTARTKLDNLCATISGKSILSIL